MGFLSKFCSIWRSIDTGRERGREIETPYKSFKYRTCHVMSWKILLSQFLSRDQTFTNSMFLWLFAKFSPRQPIFKQLDTMLVGMVYWVTANLQKFSL